MSNRKMIYVVPLPGMLVRFPKTKSCLPESGGWVPAENYWLRRISDGDVREAQPPEEKKAAVSGGMVMGAGVALAALGSALAWSISLS